jgi:invasion protein IalB
MKSRSLRSTVLWALAMLIFSGSGSTVATPAGDVTSEKFDDWELFCQVNGGCRISQRLAVEGSGETVFLITAVRSDEGGPYVGIVSVPLRGYLAPGIELRVDQRKPYQLLYETCDPAGCHAGFPLEGGVLLDFRAGTTARFRVWTAKDNPVDIDVSLIGFTRAFAALGERS